MDEFRAFHVNTILLNSQTFCNRFAFTRMISVFYFNSIIWKSFPQKSGKTEKIELNFLGNTRVIRLTVVVFGER